MGYLVSEKEYYSGKEEVPGFSMHARRLIALEDIYDHDVEIKMSKYLGRLSARVKQFELECQNQDNSGHAKVLKKK